MLAFITVVGVIPVQIYAMDLAFLAWAKVTFRYRSLLHFFVNFWYNLEMTP
jgi:hypothetical protein